MSGDPDEYVRYKSKIQLGDGIDRRGDVEVEVQRELKPPEASEASMQGRAGPDGDVVEFHPDHAAFSQFQFELDRSVSLLRDQLRLDEEGDNGGGE